MATCRRASCAQKTARCLVQPLETGLRHADQLADLHAGGLIARDDVRLHHYRHVFLERHLRQRPGRAALRAEDRREIAAAEAVHQVVVDGEAAILDHARGIDDLLHRRAVPHDSRDGVERRLCRFMQIFVQGSRIFAHGKCTQDLPRIVPPVRGKLAEDEITGRDRWLVSLPFGLAKLQALFLQFAPGPLKLTPDQVALLRSDNVVSDAAKAAGLTLEGLGITPDSMEAVARQYLWRFRSSGQFQRNGT